MDPYRLRAREVHVWRVGLDVPSARSAHLYTYLGREERERCARLRFEHDRRRFIVSHGALRDLIARYLGTRPERIGYRYNAFGKPALSPQLGSDLKFNLTHSADLALIAVSADADIGIDVERIRSQSDLIDIARIFFSAAEVDYLVTLPPGHLRCSAFFSCWTKKEAYFKASGEGLTRPLWDFSVAQANGASDAPRTPMDLFVASNDVSPAKRWSMYALAPGPGFTGALVVEGRGTRLSRRMWRAPSAPNPSAWRISA